MTWDLRELARPATESVTLTEAKLWLRVEDDATDQDAMILLLIKAARTRAEAITGRAFARRAFELRLDDFPILQSGAVAPVVIPRPPLVTLDYVTYATADGDSSWVGSPQMWDLDSGGDSNPARFIPVGGVSWPSVESRPGAVRIGFTAGYATASQMPETARLWMQERISSWFSQRETIVVGKSISEVPRDLVDGLLDELRAVTLFA